MVDATWPVEDISPSPPENCWRQDIAPGFCNGQFPCGHQDSKIHAQISFVPWLESDNCKRHRLFPICSHAIKQGQSWNRCQCRLKHFCPLGIQVWSILCGEPLSMVLYNRIVMNYWTARTISLHLFMRTYLEPWGMCKLAPLYSTWRQGCFVLNSV